MPQSTEHPEYKEIQPTHAGGVVVKTIEGRPRFLITTAKGNSNHWVFPKGHINRGETPEEAAIREVVEETGVVADIAKFIGTLNFTFRNEHVCAQYYLMHFQSETRPLEQRELRWCSYEDALQRLTFEDSRELLSTANERLSHGAK